LPIFCNLCNKGFNFDDLPTNTPIFCPDCGSPARIIDASELLQRRKNSNIDSSVTLESPTTAKTGQVDPSRTKRTEPYTPPVINQGFTTAKTGQPDPSRTKRTRPYSRPKYNRRIAFVLTSLGVIGILGVGHLYTKTTKGIKRGICFLIGGFFVYLFAIVLLDAYIFHPSVEYPDPGDGGKVGAIFFLIVFILIWLWQFLDLTKLTKYSAQ
jgi:hypothetical protein